MASVWRFLALESFLHRHQAALTLPLTATLIWAGVIVFTIGMPGPINITVSALIRNDLSI